MTARRLRLRGIWLGRREREAALYGRYCALGDLYGWPLSDRGFEGFKRTLQKGRRALWAKRST